MKPTVPGTPASPSMPIVSGHASHGLRAPSPARPLSWSSPVSRALAGVDHGDDAAMFIAR